MRAIVLREFGPPERLEPAELPDPAAGSDEVLVDVELAKSRSSTPRSVLAGRRTRP